MTSLPLGAGSRTLHKADLSTTDYKSGTTDRPTVAVGEANVISSIASRETPVPMDSSTREVPPEAAALTHWPVIDIDVPAHLVPSSTPGHSHLYIDVPVPGEQYWALLEALADAGIVQPGYVGACWSRGYTSVRLPWVRKGAEGDTPVKPDIVGELEF